MTRKKIDHRCAPVRIAMDLDARGFEIRPVLAPNRCQPLESTGAPVLLRERDVVQSNRVPTGIQDRSRRLAQLCFGSAHRHGAFPSNRHLAGTFLLVGSCNRCVHSARTQDSGTGNPDARPSTGLEISTIPALRRASVWDGLQRNRPDPWGGCKQLSCIFRSPLLHRFGLQEGPSAASRYMAASGSRKQVRIRLKFSV